MINNSTEWQKKKDKLKKLNKIWMIKSRLYNIKKNIVITSYSI